MRYPVTYRAATADDADLCVETIIRAEKGRSDILPFARIFDLTEEEVRIMLKDILLEDIEGQEMAISTFTVLMHGNEYAGACGSFIECINGVSSNRLKSDIFRHYIPAEKFYAALPVLKILQPLNIEREPHAVQMESLYIIEKFRCMELYLDMVKTIAEGRIAQYPELNITRSYAGFSEQNWFMGKAAARIGYRFHQEVKIDNPEALKYVSSLKRYVVMKQH
jgi:hypothetical protein